MAARKQRRLVVECRRDNDGHVYSQVRDESVAGYDEPRPIVFDRQRGRMLGPDTIAFRAKALASLIGVPFKDYPEIPCISKTGLRDCRCPDCVKERSRGRA
jgi:hypothetical protein